MVPMAAVLSSPINPQPKDGHSHQVWSSKVRRSPADEDVEAGKVRVGDFINSVRDLEITELAAEPRDAEAAVNAFVPSVADLEEPAFAFDRDAEAAVNEFVPSVADLEETAFAAGDKR